MTRSELGKEEIVPYYWRYIDKVAPSQDLSAGFEQGQTTIPAFFEALPVKKLDYRYAPGKWSIREVLQHLIDTERIFMYRCFRIARRDQTVLAGFDQEAYVAPSGAEGKPLEALVEEFLAVRSHSISLLSSLSSYNLAAVGVATQGSMSARAAAFTVIGHEVWHMEVIKSKYL